MKTFNRAFAITVALLWLAAGAGILYMLWVPARGIDIDRTRATAILHLAFYGSNRVLAALVVIAAMLPSLALLFFEARPLRTKSALVHEAGTATDDRYRRLDQRLDDLQRRLDAQAATARRAPSPGEPAMVREPVYEEPPRRRWGLLSRERRTTS